MAKQSYVISGDISYAFVTPDNMSYTYDTDGKYVVKLFPDEKSMHLIEELGAMHLLREPGEKDQGPFVNLSRPSKKPIFNTDGKPTGQTTQNTPPILHGVPNGAKIGSGSSGMAQFHTYVGKGKKVYFELEGLRIDNLVEFTGGTGEGGGTVDLLKIVE